MGATRGLPALAVLLALLTELSGCGGNEPLPEGTRTVVLVTVDDLRKDRLAPYGFAAQPTPALSKLGAEGTVQPDVIAPAKSRNASLASLLTGLTPPAHALRMDAPGRHRLAGRFTTLAESFAEAGFQTAAVVANRQLAPRLCGLDQGFERYQHTGLPENGAALPALEVAGRAVAELQGLERTERLFLWLHFGHLRAEPDELSAKEEGLLRARLLAFAPSVPELARELESLDLTQPLLPRIEGAIGRRRGSPAWRALREVLYDVQVERLDTALAGVLAELERSGRYGDAVVAVVGTRGCYLTEARPDGRVEGFSTGLVRVPLILRAPDEVPLLEGPRSAAVVAPLLRRVLDPALPLPEVEPVRVYADEWAVAEVQPEFKLIGKQGSEAIWIRRLDDAVLGMPTTFETASGGPLPDSSGGTIRVDPGAEAPMGLPLLPDRGAAEWPAPQAGEAPGWSVDVELEGTWWNVSVTDPERVGAEVRVFAAVDLASGDQDPLETRLDASVTRLSDPALFDAVVLAGKAPLVASIKARARARLGLAVTVDGEPVPAERMRYIGHHFVGQRLDYLAPPWMPERPDWFSSLSPPVSELWDVEPWSTIRDKRGTGVYLMEGAIDLGADEIRFLKRMKATE